MAQTVILNDPKDKERAILALAQAAFGSRVFFTDAKESRTTQQNRTIHMWFGEIAEQQADMSANEVKGVCHRRWGLGIRLRDPQFAWIWANTGERLPYEKQCSLLASGILKVSSGMSVDELGEYMDAMYRHFTGDGVSLTDPELRKYEGAA